MNEDAKLYKVSLFHHLSAPAASFSKSTTKQSPQYERWNERKQNLAHSRTIKQKSNVSGLILKLIIFDVVRLYILWFVQIIVHRQDKGYYIAGSKLHLVDR
jgi:hypothetical protein